MTSQVYYRKWRPKTFSQLVGQEPIAHTLMQAVVRDRVAHAIGRAQMAAFAPKRIGLIIAGFEVPHTHLHVVPIDHMGHLDFGQADDDADPEDLDAVADELRAVLLADGHPEVT